MCNHYEKNLTVFEMAANLVRDVSWTVNADGDVVPPDDVARVAEDVWPKALAPVVVQTATGRALETLRWGIRLEIRDQGKNVVRYTTNARADNLSGWAWRKSAAERRCLIPATAYYEPGLGPVGARGEVRFSVKRRPRFFLAGIWDRDPGDEGERSFAMVTTTPNDYVARYHDRMPVVLDDAAALAWLGDRPLAAERLRALCAGLPSDAVQHEEIAAKPRAKITKSDLKDGQGLLF